MIPKHFKNAETLIFFIAECICIMHIIMPFIDKEQEPDLACLGYGLVALFLGALYKIFFYKTPKHTLPDKEYEDEDEDTLSGDEDGDGDEGSL